MRKFFALGLVACAACVKAPHESEMAYSEFDRAPDYVWRSYVAPDADEAQRSYWTGYQSWLCPQMLDGKGKWVKGASTRVQRTVACDPLRREQRRDAAGRRSAAFQEALSQVEPGMSGEEVRALLGRPSEIQLDEDGSDGALWVYRDVSRRRVILHLRFRDRQLDSVEPL